MIKIARRHERISIHPEVMGGKPCIKGTRIPVDLVLRYLGNGQSVEDILEAFPGSRPRMCGRRSRLPPT
jgi:uncharacterized protein (DUF433 family)